MRILQFFFLGIFLIACDGSKDVLPKSTGSANEIIVVVSDAIWSKFPSKAVKDNFEKDYPGLQQSEPLFNIIRIKPSDFSTIFKTHQNIILISENGEEGRKNDLWASPQLVARLKWNLESEQKQFAENSKKYANDFYESQLQKINQKYTNSEKTIKNKFGIDIKIPSEFSIINDSTNIFWATYNPPKSDLIKQILVFSLRVSEINFHENLMLKVDSVLAKTLKGRGENNFVQTEKRFPLEISDNTYRGLWKMENEFMGGPFLMKIQNTKEGIVIVSIGIVFAPGEAKKRFIVEMDALL